MFASWQLIGSKFSTNRDEKVLLFDRWRRCGPWRLATLLHQVIRKYHASAALFMLFTEPKRWAASARKSTRIQCRGTWMAVGLASPIKPGPTLFLMLIHCMVSAGCHYFMAVESASEIHQRACCWFARHFIGEVICSLKQVVWDVGCRTVAWLVLAFMHHVKITCEKRFLVVFVNVKASSIRTTNTTVIIHSSNDS